MNNIFDEFSISKKTQLRAQEAIASCKSAFEEIDRVREHNQLFVLDCFTKERIAPAHFNATYGYGYDDAGRDALARLFARVFKAQRAIVRPQIASGTHALALALTGIAKKGFRFLSASGAPYDTLDEIIGKGENPSPFSLCGLGCEYSELALKGGKIDFELLEKRAAEADVVMLQRSRGYADRPSLTVDVIEQACKTIKRANENAIIFVDNCYGEFVEEREPIEAGADLIVGSLIKNAGGGIAPTGAYIAGRADLIEQIEFRMTAPGIGGEVGSYAGGYLPFFEGLFLAPHVVGEALKGAVFTSSLLSDFEPSPAFGDARGCIIQSLHLKNAENIIAFSQAIQHCSPVDSFVTPVPWAMPGYSDEVIMAAGTFVQGASIELSGDAPIREPFVFYMQGGLVFEQVKLAVMYALDRMEEIL